MQGKQPQGNTQQRDLFLFTKVSLIEKLSALVFLTPKLVLNGYVKVYHIGPETVFIRISQTLGKV